MKIKKESQENQKGVLPWIVDKPNMGKKIRVKRGQLIWILMIFLTCSWERGKKRGERSEAFKGENNKHRENKSYAVMEECIYRHEAADMESESLLRHR
jgi:hypothetical protein